MIKNSTETATCGSKRLAAWKCTTAANSSHLPWDGLMGRLSGDHGWNGAHYSLTVSLVRQTRDKRKSYTVYLIICKV